MDNNDLRAKAMQAIKEVVWVPKWGMDRILGMVEGRPDWCLSRQRAWGVPLTVFTCKGCGQVVADQAVADRIDTLFRREGADAWFRHENSAFLGDGYCCSSCGGSEFDKERDILDVWFDSGVSFAAVLEQRPELAAPADLYLEGSDQHRGWFQSSLLASVGTRGTAPFRSVLTHGFVVDGQGKKMSKSVGNVIAPEEIIKQYGAEILRLWVASEDYRDDIKISDDILRQLSDAYRKIRNTIRFFLGNLSDFNPDQESVAYVDMDELDRWAMHQFELLKRKVSKGYADFEFHAVFHGLYSFCTLTMSALYLDIIKDRLYTLPAGAKARKSAQTVLHVIAEGLLLLMAPVLTFTAAEAWEHLPASTSRERSIFLAQLPPVAEACMDEELNARWERLLAVRGEMTKVLELARQDKVIGHSLEAQVTLSATGELASFLKANWATLQTVAIVSDLKLVEAPGVGARPAEEIPGLTIAVQAAPGGKCERCWTRTESVGSHADHPLLCSRCAGVVVSL
jgi:isoleucyl-tRNA synthetase